MPMNGSATIARRTRAFFLRALIIRSDCTVDLKGEAGPLPRVDSGQPVP